MKTKSPYQSPFDFWKKRLSHATHIQLENCDGVVLVKWPLRRPPFKVKGRTLVFGFQKRKAKPCRSGYAVKASIVDTNGTELHHTPVTDYPSCNSFVTNNRFVALGASQAITAFTVTDGD